MRAMIKDGLKQKLQNLTIGLKPIYNLKGFLVRIGIDLAILNLGFLTSFLLSLVYYVLIREAAAAEKVAQLLIENWQENVPLLTLLGAVVFIGSGLYALGPQGQRYYRFFVAIRAMLTLCILFIFLGIYVNSSIIPAAFNAPSSLIVGWGCACLGWLLSTGLICGIRVGRSLYYQSFLHIPRRNASGLVKTMQDVASTTAEFSYIAPPKEGGRELISPRFADWPYFSDAEIQASAAILSSGRVNRWTGEQNTLFEAEFAKICESKHAIALANGTLALELALYGLKIGPGDEIIVPCRTFVASASCIVMRGATPVIVDVDRTSQNLTAETIRAGLSNKTRAIICVHLNGWPCDMDPIIALAKERGILVIEDCAQAHGARYKGCPVGSLGDVAAFSFCQDKIMTTGGEGGMVVTQDTALWKRMWAYKDHGKDYNTVYHQEQGPGFRWYVKSFGTNWRMTEMQAAIGREQLKRLPEWSSRRRLFAGILHDQFADLNTLRLTIPQEHEGHAYYKYYVFVRPENIREGWNRDRIIDEINARGVPCMQGACGQIQREEAFKSCGRVAEGDFAASQELMERGLMLLVHPTLEEKDILAAAKVVKEVMKDATV